jgi:hypothetical protein
MALQQYGFIEAGEWYLFDKFRSKVKAKLSRLADKRVVYAFVVDDEVKYVGICDSDKTTLEKRMGSQRFNKNMPDLIRTTLEEGKAVKILALVPEELEYKGLKLDLVWPLEQALIAQLKPKWNVELSKYMSQKW